MSRTKPTDNDRAQLTFACDTCNARPDEWCYVHAGLVYAGRLHTNRWRKAMRIVELTGMSKSWRDMSARLRSARGELLGLRGELLQVQDRGLFADPSLLIERINKILEAS